MGRAILALAAACFTVAASHVAGAPLAGTLKRIDEAGIVRVGYRDSAIPFSYRGRDGKPTGYSIDLCLAIAGEISTLLGRKLQVEYRPVTPTDRLDQVIGGRVDLECGSTSINDERATRVAFSPVIFTAGTRLLVKRGGAIHSMRDLEGKSVAGVRGTTNARAMLALGTGRIKNLRILTADTYDQGLALLGTGAVDAMAADDILMLGLLHERGLRSEYLMVGDPLTHEAYGIAFARDDMALADAVQRAFARLASSGQLRAIYRKWFVQPLASGEALGLPMSAALEESFRALGLPPE